MNPKSVDFLPFPSLPKSLWKASNGGLGCNSIFKFFLGSPYISYLISNLSRMLIIYIGKISQSFIQISDY